MMKKIILKRLKLVNFKGIKEKAIDFTNHTNIYGDNATGKTTVFDAFMWVMFGKDSSDKKDFNIKTLDENGIAIPKIEHEVEAVLDIDETEVTLKSVLREKWVTERGDTEPKFKGHETTYFYNDVPMKQEEYKKKIKEIVDEKVFKIITNPVYFNTLKWQDMRSILFELVSLQTDKEIAQSCKGVEYLAEIFDTKDISEYKKEVAAKKKKIKEELDAIPTRIDEVIKGTPENENWDELEKQILDKTNDIDCLNKQINGSFTESENNLKINEQINELKTKLLSFKADTENSYLQKRTALNEKTNSLKVQIDEINFNIESCKRKKSSIQKEINESNELLEILRNKIKDLNNKVFDENTTVCPTCGRAFETDKIEEMKLHFEESKKEEFNKLNERGINLKAGVVKSQELLEETIAKENEFCKKLESLQNEYGINTAELNSLKAPKIEELKEYIEIREKISLLEEKKDKPIDTSELEEQKKLLTNELKELQSRLLQKDVIEKSKQRVQELEQSQKQLAQSKADLDKTEFDIEKFIKFKIENFENSVNSMFKIVKFKLFETQINGSEVECCKTTVDGVPFSDLNNAMKVNAGIDIINTLCDRYEVSAPIFIDNRESINNLIESESQIINLIVSKDKALKVEVE